MSQHQCWIPLWVNEVLSLIKQLAQQQQTMLIITHKLQFSREVADSVIFIADGEFVEQGPPHQIFSQPKDLRPQAF
ncbi:hypothetical protein [Photobacterium sp. GB-50]|uniref:hypothetical protein n=1 Tax=Photobacterium sp. GB-50 TaxID=2022107 RepID=UPI001E3A0AC9|nr:hypothetical protein [Photobacterium sp. GB-50]